MLDRVHRPAAHLPTTAAARRGRADEHGTREHDAGRERPQQFLASSLPRHDLSGIFVWQPQVPRAGSVVRAGESDTEEAPVPDNETRLAQVPPSDAGVPATDAGAPAVAAPSASFSITGEGSYADTPTESRKKVTFHCTWKGGAKEDYIIVNWLKGSMKDDKGKPYKVTMFGAPVDFDFADWRVDSLDKDPAYWSSGGTRWRYTVDAPNKFSATDNPGPMLDSDGKGAVAKVDFKAAVYKAADVGDNETGPTISATPLSTWDNWTYHVEVLGGGKFGHPK